MPSLEHLLLSSKPTHSRRRRRRHIKSFAEPIRLTASPEDQHARRSSSTTSALAICRDAGSCAVATPAVQLKGSSVSSSLGGPDAESATSAAGQGGAADAIVALLSSVAERFLEDGEFRVRIREACLAGNEGDDSSKTAPTASATAIADLKTGIEAMDSLLGSGTPTTSRSAEDTRNSLNDSKRLFQSAAAVPDLPPSLTALAHLYLSATRRIEGSHRSAAGHVLRAIRSAPRIARTELLPGLWARLFHAHLIHLEAWRRKEVTAVEAMDDDDDARRKREEELGDVYDEEMDSGTARLAGCYLDWIRASRARQLQALPPVNGSIGEKDDKMSGGGKVAACSEAGRETGKEVGSCKIQGQVHVSIDGRIQQNDVAGERKQSTPRPPLFSRSFRMFTCDGNAHRGVVQCSQSLATDDPSPSSKEDDASRRAQPPLMSLSQAISLVSSTSPPPRILHRREAAVQVIGKAWLETKEKKNPADLEKAISSPEVVEGILQVSSTTENDKVGELAVSILAELVMRNKVRRRSILNADPQLEYFSRMLHQRNNTGNLSLKAAVLLYMLRPQAKQLLSAEWVTLALRVLERGGNQQQSLLSVTCSPKPAALYLLEQLVRGCDADRCLENAKQVVALGGHKLLMGALESGEARWRKIAAALLVACLRADGSCREDLSASVKKRCILELLVGNQLKSDGQAFTLLLEALFLSRRTRITSFLIDLKKEPSLNAMHVLLVYLQQSPADRRPLVASLLLQLDLLGDCSRFSIYREEAVEAILGALSSKSGNKVQEQCSRALMILAGRFSVQGEPSSEEWFLKVAGFSDGCPAELCIGEEEKEEDTVGGDATKPPVSSASLLCSQTTTPHNNQNNGDEDEEEEGREMGNWLRRLAVVLLTRGNDRLLSALSECIADGIPTLSRSCLVTVAWMSTYVSPQQNVQYFWYLAKSTLVPRLLECLGHDRASEDRVLASLSLLNFARNSDCFPELLPLDSDANNNLQDLSRFTWTSKELLVLVDGHVSNKPSPNI